MTCYLVYYTLLSNYFWLWILHIILYATSYLEKDPYTMGMFVYIIYSCLSLYKASMGVICSIAGAMTYQMARTLLAWLLMPLALATGSPAALGWDCCKLPCHNCDRFETWASPSFVEDGPSIQDNLVEASIEVFKVISFLESSSLDEKPSHQRGHAADATGILDL